MNNTVVKPTIVNMIIAENGKLYRSPAQPRPPVKRKIVPFRERFGLTEQELEEYDCFCQEVEHARTEW